jgi:hypothetical protein
VTVDRHARRDDDAVIAGQVRLQQVGDLRLAGDGGAGILAIVPREHLRAAGRQRVDRGEARPRKAQHRIASAGKGGGDDHRSFNVARPASASTKDTIQKRMTTVVSCQPSCSK